MTPTTLPIIPTANSLEAFLRICLEDDASQAVCCIAQVMPQLTMNQLALFIAGKARVERDEKGDFILRLL